MSFSNSDPHLISVNARNVAATIRRRLILGLAMVIVWPPLRGREARATGELAAGEFFWHGVLLNPGEPDAIYNGNGSTGDPNNWLGRYIITPQPPDPPLVTWYLPEDGDGINITDSDSLIHGLHEIQVSDFDYPSSNLQVRIGGTLSGGRLNMETILIETTGDRETGDPLMLAFNDTELDAASINISNTLSTIDFTGQTIVGDAIGLRGYNAPGALGTLRPIRFHNSNIDTFVLDATGERIVGQPGIGPVLEARFDASTLTGIGVHVGHNDFEGYENSTEMILENESDFQLSGFLIIGENSPGKLTLNSGSKITSPDADLVVGQDADGELNVTGESEVNVDHLEVGLRATGDLTIDTDAKLVTTDALLGIVNGFDSIAILRSGGTWETEDLIVGEDGIGIINVLENSRLKITGDAILGNHASGEGLLNLIGSTAQLELGPAGTLTIGKAGSGELHLLQGASFTSDGNVTLGESSGSSSIVTAEGENSQWTVAGTLTVGEHSHGTVKVTDGGTLSVTGDQISLGAEADGEGTLTVDGDESSLDFQNDLMVGELGKGTVDVTGGASVTVRVLDVGVFADSEGTVTVSGRGDAPSKLETTSTAPITIGNAGAGTLNLKEGAEFVTNSSLTLGKDAGSTGIAIVLGLQNQTPDDNTSWTANGPLVIGDEGHAIVTVDRGGKIAAKSDVTIGDQFGSDSQLIVQGTGSAQDPLLESVVDLDGKLTVGRRGTGHLDVLNGASFIQRVANDVVFGSETGTGYGTIGGEGTDVTFRGKVVVGKAGNGQLDIAAKARLNLRGTTTVLGDENGAHGTLSITGDGNGDESLLFFSSHTLQIGNNGTGTMTITQGAIVDANDSLSVELGAGTTGDGTLTVQGDYSRLKTTDLTVGGSGKGKLMIIGSGVTQPGAIVVNNGVEAKRDVTLNAGSEIDVNGGTLQLTGEDFAFPRFDVRGKLTVHNRGAAGGFSFNRPLTLNSGGANAEISLSQDSVLRVDTALVGEAGPAIVQINTGSSFVTHGKLTIKSGSQVTASGVGDNPSEIEANALDMGIESAAMVSIETGALLRVHQNNLRIGTLGTATVTGSASRFDVDGVTQVAGRLNMQSGGRGHGTALTIDGGGVVTVAATAQAGAGAITLGDPSLPAPLGAVQVNSGGFVSGSGRIVGNLIAKNPNAFPGTVTGARIKLGNSPGTLTVEGDVSLEQGTILEVEIGGSAPGTQYDQLVATGSLVAAGVLDLRVVNSGSGFQLPAVGSQYTILTAGAGLTSAFQNSASLRSVAGGSLVHWSLTAGAGALLLNAAAITALPTGDYNGNGVVDLADYTVWRNSVGMIDLAADGNHDGQIDALDYNVWKANFGMSLGGGALAAEPSPAPEPTTIVSSLIASLLLVSARGRINRGDLP
jgi:T5SS/PEP-CTERM-associated repeat protein